jgi:hypothetical protein
MYSVHICPSSSPSSCFIVSSSVVFSYYVVPVLAGQERTCVATTAGTKHKALADTPQKHRAQLGEFLSNSNFR